MCASRKRETDGSITDNVNFDSSVAVNKNLLNLCIFLSSRSIYIFSKDSLFVKLLPSQLEVICLCAPT